MSAKGIVCGEIISGNDEIYNDGKWPTEASPEEVSVIHLLTVHDDFAGMGFAKRLISYEDTGLADFRMYEMVL